MRLLLLLLLVASLAVPPVFSQTYQKFVKQHTYSGNTLVDCTRELNPILKSLNKPCKPCNSFILGDGTYSTDMNDVDKICNGGGTRKPNTNLYVSNRSFHVLKCKRDNNKSGAQPPNCVYKKVGSKDVQTMKITVACVNKLPVHFQGC